MFRECATAGFLTKKEDVVGVDGTRERTDVYVTDFPVNEWVNGKQVEKNVEMHFDAAIVDTTCASALATGSANTPGKYASITAKFKTRKYKPLLAQRSSNCRFRPIVMETGGHLEAKGIDTLRDLARFSTTKALTGLEICAYEDDWRTLFSARLNAYYQVFSSVCIKSVEWNMQMGVGKLLHAEKFRSNMNVVTPLRERQMNKSKIELGNAKRAAAAASLFA